MLLQCPLQSTKKINNHIAGALLVLLTIVVLARRPGANEASSSLQSYNTAIDPNEALMVGHQPQHQHSLTLIDVKTLFFQEDAKSRQSDESRAAAAAGHCKRLQRLLLKIQATSTSSSRVKSSVEGGQQHEYNYNTTVAAPPFVITPSSSSEDRSSTSSCPQHRPPPVLVIPTRAIMAEVVDLEGFLKQLIRGICGPPLHHSSSSDQSVLFPREVQGVLWVPDDDKQPNSETTNVRTPQAVIDSAQRVLNKLMIANHDCSLASSRAWVGEASPPPQPPPLGQWKGPPLDGELLHSLASSQLSCKIRNQLSRRRLSSARTRTTEELTTSAPRGSAFHVAEKAHVVVPFFLSHDLVWMILETIAPRVLGALRVLQQNTARSATSTESEGKKSNDQSNPTTSANDISGDGRNKITLPTDARASFDDMMSLTKTPTATATTTPAVQAARISWTSLGSTLGRISPILTSCGIPSQYHHRIHQLPEFDVDGEQVEHGGNHIGGTTPPSPLWEIAEQPISLPQCIALMLSGRDVHRYTFQEWAHHQQQQQSSGIIPLANESVATTKRSWMRQLEKRSERSLSTGEQMPFTWLLNDVSFRQILSNELRDGLPWRDETSGGAIRHVRVHAVRLAPVSMPSSGEATHKFDDGVIAAVYVPTRIDQFGMRDMVRCYYRSLERPVRDRLALHFLLGARATMDSRFVFRGRGDVRAEDTYIADSSGLSVWHRLVLENRSHDFERRSTSVARDSGDLLLLDVIDLDRAPYSTKSEESRLRGVWRAKETLVKPRRGRRPEWHHVSEVSAMLIKLLVGMAHMVQQYPTSRFFVRGADDAYVSFRQVYVDALKLVSEEEKHAATNRRKFFGGHVITTAINNVCGNFEVSKSGVLYRSGGVSRDRALAPVMSPAYVSGGGSTMNSELVRQLVHSLQDLPPTLWLEEDTMIGRLTAPMVRPTKDFRFHNFFNATQRVDTAFQGQVPRAYIYCHQNSWVVHKYPAPSALSFVDAKTLYMYCTRHDFMSARATAHHCAATLGDRALAPVMSPAYVSGGGSTMN
ncbi:transmembrane protein, putative, partial [Bodo saltans]